MNKLVSIIIPTFNRAKTLTRAIKSCLDQTYKELEILVIDDCSTDNTRQAVEEFADKRVRYISHSKNSGPAASRNTGIRNASGEFLAFLDSDDEWAKNKIERQLTVFGNLSTNEENVGLIFVNGYNEAEGHVFIKGTESGIVYSPRRDAFYPLRVLICPPSAWLLPRKVISNIGFFDERMYNWDDGDYLARVAYRYDIYFLNELLVTWHGSAVHVNKMSENLIKGKEIFLENNYQFIKKDRKYLFKFYRALGKDSIAINKLKARHYLKRAFLMRPYDFSVLSKLAKTF